MKKLLLIAVFAAGNVVASTANLTQTQEAIAMAKFQPLGGSRKNIYPDCNATTLRDLKTHGCEYLALGGITEAETE